jgi:hypothetical protein
MISRFLEKKVEITGREISENACKALELEYYLVESVGTDHTESPDIKEYGIEIVEKEKGSIVESRTYKNIYSSRDQVETLLKLLVDNSVTPVSLPYILDDILGNE